MTSRPRLRACVVGHSFVRRLREAVISDAEGSTPVHRHAPNWLDVSRLYGSVYVEGRSGYTISGLRRDIFEAGSRYPHVVIINCGSNDVCTPDFDADAAVSALMSYAGLLRISYGVRLVVLMPVINRTRCRGLAAGEFRRRAYDFNGLLRSRAGEEDGVCVEPMRGFWRDDCGGMLPVRAWSSDGIHPGPAVTSSGFGKYRRNIRRVLLAAGARVLDEMEAEADCTFQRWVVTSLDGHCGTFSPGLSIDDSPISVMGAPDQNL